MIPRDLAETCGIQGCETHEMAETCGIERGRRP
jgi:hypothetical protein